MSILEVPVTTRRQTSSHALGLYSSCHLGAAAAHNMSVDELKAAGNTSFREGRFSEAVRTFSEAITMDPANATSSPTAAALSLRWENMRRRSPTRRRPSPSTRAGQGLFTQGRGALWPLPF